MDNKNLATSIYKNVGGFSNISALTHCMTRLRFVVKSYDSVDIKAIEDLEGVLSVVRASGQLQIVIGPRVEEVYNHLEFLLDKDRGKTSLKIDPSAKKGKIMGLISQIFTPIIPAIAAAGLIKGILTLISILMKNKGIDVSTSDTYTILFAASQVIFYFFPIFLGYTTAKALKCNEIVAMMVGAFLVFPAIDQMVTATDINSTFLGIPIPKQAFSIGGLSKVFSYTESVIPIILSVIILSYVERFLKRVIPEVLQLILVPGLSLLIILPLSLIVVGPIGIYIGFIIQKAYSSLINLSPTLAGAMVGGLWAVFVIFGAHRALLPIGLNDVALTGMQNILAFAGAANFAQAGAGLGIFLKSKDKNIKQIAASGAISAGLVGITEPVIYGINLRYKKPMIFAIISGAIGGGLMGFGGVFGDAFANNGILTIFTYAGFGMRKFAFYLIGIGVSFFGAMVLSYLFTDVTKE